jgi:hypothetical protein
MPGDDEFTKQFLPCAESLFEVLDGISEEFDSCADKHLLLKTGLYFSYCRNSHITATFYYNPLALHNIMSIQFSNFIQAFLSFASHI